MNNASFRITFGDVTGIISSILCIVGSFLPWAELNILFISDVKYGIEGDGQITIILGLIALILVIIGLFIKKHDFPLIGIFLLGLGAVVLLIAIVDGIDVANLSDKYYTDISIGLGLYIVGISGIGLIISGFLLILKSRKYPEYQEKQLYKRFCSNCGRTLSADYKLCPYCGTNIR